MPYRSVPPWHRPWWEKLTGVYLAVALLVGVTGILWPSKSVAEVIEAGHLLYSSCLVLFGAVGVGAWWRGLRRLEGTSMAVLTILTLLHGLLIFAASGAAGAQTAIRLGMAAIGMAAWIGLRQEFGASRTEIVEAVTRCDQDESK